MKDVTNGMRAFDCRFRTPRGGERSWVRYYPEAFGCAEVWESLTQTLEQEFPDGYAILSVHPLRVAEIG